MPVITPRQTLLSRGKNFLKMVALPATAIVLIGGFVTAAVFEANQNREEQQKQKQVEEKMSQIRLQAQQRQAERLEQEAKETLEQKEIAVKETERRLLDAFNKGSKKVVLADGVIYALMNAENIDGERILSAHKIIGTAEDSSVLVIDQTPVARMSVPKP